jgi:hypothetical protein
VPRCEGEQGTGELQAETERTRPQVELHACAELSPVRRCWVGGARPLRFSEASASSSRSSLSASSSSPSASQETLPLACGVPTQERVGSPLPSLVLSSKVDVFRAFHLLSVVRDGGGDRQQPT